GSTTRTTSAPPTPSAWCRTCWPWPSPATTCARSRSRRCEPPRDARPADPRAGDAAGGGGRGRGRRHRRPPVEPGHLVVHPEVVLAASAPAGVGALLLAEGAGGRPVPGA